MSKPINRALRDAIEQVVTGRQPSPVFFEKPPAVGPSEVTRDVLRDYSTVRAKFILGSSSLGCGKGEVRTVIVDELEAYDEAASNPLATASEAKAVQTTSEEIQRAMEELEALRRSGPPPAVAALVHVSHRSVLESEWIALGIVHRPGGKPMGLPIHFFDSPESLVVAAMRYKLNYVIVVYRDGTTVTKRGVEIVGTQWKVIQPIVRFPSGVISS